MKGQSYFKEMYIHEIEAKWGIDLSAISNNGGAEKRFDFVVKGSDTVSGIEINLSMHISFKLLLFLITQIICSIIFILSIVILFN